MRRGIGSAAVGLAFLLAGCSLLADLDVAGGAADAPAPRDGNGDGGAAEGGGSSEPSRGVSTTGAFTIEVASGQAFLDPGEQNVSVSVALRRSPGFAAPVTITFNGLPSAVVASGLTLSSSSAGGAVALGAQREAKASASAVTVVAVAGSETAEASLALFVTGELAGLDADGEFVVPSPAPSELAIVAWGAGGGGGSVNNQNNSAPHGGGAGGAGGFASGLLAVTAGDKLLARVGRGGAKTSQSGGAGGGYSSVTRGDVTLLVAGAGGGGGAGYAQTNAASGTPGGAGGGVKGQSGGGGEGGGPGTDVAGGAADVCTAKAGCDGTKPTAGAPRLGGTAGYQGSATTSLVQGGAPGGGATTDREPSGGGGGGGWFGGGGGGFRVVDATYVIYRGNGGGGGSSFVDATRMRPLTESSPMLVAGSGATPPNTNDARYRDGIAVGGAGAVKYGSAATPGGNGRVAIAIVKPSR